MILTVVAVIPAIVERFDQWAEGPLPLTWRLGTPRAIVADTAGRTRYADEKVVGCLYAVDGRPIRFHRAMDVPLQSVPGMTVQALEYLSLDHVVSSSGFLAVHLQSGMLPDWQSVTDAINNCTNYNAVHAASLRAELTSLIGPLGGQITPEARRVLSVTLLEPSTGGNLYRPNSGKRFDDWEEADLWLAVAYEQGRLLPDPDGHERLAIDYRSAAYRSGASRHGTSIVSTPAESQIEDQGLRFFAKGFHVDLLLLIAAQERIIQDMYELLEELLLRPSRSTDLQRLQQRIVRFRATYWIPSFAPQGPYDTLLIRLQNERHLPELYESLSRSAEQFGQLVQTQVNHDTNKILLLIAVVSLPIGAAIAIWQGFATQGNGARILPFFLLGAVVLAAILTALPVSRRAVGTKPRGDS